MNPCVSIAVRQGVCKGCGESRRSGKHTLVLILLYTHEFAFFAKNFNIAY
jgi:hypothetical protein